MTSRGEGWRKPVRAAFALALLAAFAVLVWRARRGAGLPSPSLEPVQQPERAALEVEPAVPERVALAPGESETATTPAPESEGPASEQQLGELRGCVVLEDGRAVGADIEVLAWSDLIHPSAEIASLARAGDPRACIARTDEAGEFVLRGLDPGRPYMAVAAGRGYASPEYATHLRAGGTDVRLVVHRCYAAWIRLREEGGQPIRTSPHMFDRRFGTIRGGQGPPLYKGSPQLLLLLGLDDELDSTLRDRFCVLTSPMDQPVLGGIL